MECTLAALIACFSWSNLYIDVDLVAFDKTFQRQEWRVDEIRGDGVIETYGRYVWTDRANNPYVSPGIGYQLQLANWTIAAEVRHLTSTATDSDRGLNFVSLKARWFPFR